LKKVLIISYYWPPSGGGGVQRWVKFVKYLRDFGWEPIVFTPENPEMPSYDASLLSDIPASVQVIKNKIWEPYSYYKRFTGRKKTAKIQTAFLEEEKRALSFFESISLWIRSNLFIPDARKFWIRPSVNMLTKHLKNYPVDVVISTGPPHSAHLIGLELKKRLNISWLADFRDPWTNIDYYHELNLTKRSNRKHHRLEKEVLETADAITVISPGMKAEFNQIVNRKYSVIPNGFDNEDVKTVDGGVSKSKKFSLAHIGSLTKTRNPINLWEALKRIVEEDDDFAVDLEILNVGKIDINAVKSLETFGLSKYLKQVDYMPHNEVIAEQRKAILLLLLVNNTPNAKLILTGKIFEYLASETPIICIAPEDGDAANVIKETSCGQTFGFEKVDDLKDYILSYYQQFKRGELISAKGDIKKYERKQLTKKMSDALSEILK